MVPNDWAIRLASVIATALREFAPDVAISFSGAEDVVLIDMASKIGGDFRRFQFNPEAGS